MSAPITATKDLGAPRQAQQASNPAAAAPFSASSSASTGGNQDGSGNSSPNSSKNRTGPFFPNRFIVLSWPNSSGLWRRGRRRNRDFLESRSKRRFVLLIVNAMINSCKICDFAPRFSSLGRFMILDAFSPSSTEKPNSAQRVHFDTVSMETNLHFIFSGSASTPQGKRMIIRSTTTNTQYECIKASGKGSFGVVYKATNCATGEVVAIKRVLQDRRYKVRCGAYRRRSSSFGVSFSFSCRRSVVFP
jgi:hypothetical protein